MQHTCIRDDGGTPSRRCEECEAEAEFQRLVLQSRAAHKAKELPNGTPCLVTRDDGTILHSVTRSDPYEFSGSSGTWVVKVDGIAGCYALERVRKADVFAICRWLGGLGFRVVETNESVLLSENKGAHT